MVSGDRIISDPLFLDIRPEPSQSAACRAAARQFSRPSVCLVCKLLFMVQSLQSFRSCWREQVRQGHDPSPTASSISTSLPPQEDGLDLLAQFDHLPRKRLAPVESPKLVDLRMRKELGEPF